MDNKQKYEALKQALKIKESSTVAKIYLSNLENQDGFIEKMYTQGCMYHEDEFTGGTYSDLSLDHYDPNIDYSKYEAVDATTMMVLDLKENSRHSIVLNNGKTISRSDVIDWRND